jgi:hypothetical protein
MSCWFIPCGNICRGGLFRVNRAAGATRRRFHTTVIASEAKQSSFGAAKKAGLLRRGACHRAALRADPLAPRNDGNHSAKPPHSRGAKTPGRCMVRSRLDNEGAGKAGRSPHPQPRVRKKAHECSHHRFAEITRPSLRNGFNGCFVLSPAIGLFCHRRRRNCFHRLDASVEASGPHDFTVRRPAPSSEAPPASTASRPASVTIAIRPLCGAGREEI